MTYAEPDNSIYEPTVIHGFNCQSKIGCKCTPMPKEVRSHHSLKPDKEGY